MGGVCHNVSLIITSQRSLVKAPPLPPSSTSHHSTAGISRVLCLILLSNSLINNTQDTLRCWVYVGSWKINVLAFHLTTKMCMCVRFQGRSRSTRCPREKWSPRTPRLQREQREPWCNGNTSYTFTL